MGSIVPGPIQAIVYSPIYTFLGGSIVPGWEWWFHFEGSKTTSALLKTSYLFSSPFIGFGGGPPPSSFEETSFMDGPLVICRIRNARRIIPDLWNQIHFQKTYGPILCWGSLALAIQQKSITSPDQNCFCTIIRLLTCATVKAGLLTSIAI